MSDWRLANSLIAFRNQLNTAYPARSKASDGTIGDSLHSARVSDHNPDNQGVVAAIDITHDPAHGLDIQTLADKLIASHDLRIKYVIANRRIWQNGSWEAYTGSSDPHTNHLHLSVNQYNYDDASKWNLQGAEPMVNNVDNEFARWSKLFQQIRGRTPNRDEFVISAVGRTWLSAMEILSDSEESDQTTADQSLGAVARRDNWQGQIYALQDTTKSLQTQLTELKAQCDDLAKRPTREAFDALQKKLGETEQQAQQAPAPIELPGGKTEPEAAEPNVIKSSLLAKLVTLFLNLKTKQ